MSPEANESKPQESVLRPSTTRKSFYFVLNRIDVEGNQPIEIVPQHYLQLADDSQIQEIRKKVLVFQGVELPFDVAHFLYEQDMPPGANRYWVIAFEGANHEEMDLEIALALTPTGLRLGMTFIALMEKGLEKYGFGWHPHAIFNFYEREKWLNSPAALVTNAEINEVRNIHSLLKQTQQNWPAHYSAARRFLYINALPQRSEFFVLALFSIIEFLITHAPDPTDPTESLTRQVISKMALLARRFQRSLDTAAYFDGAAHNTIWSKLYSYRSHIAHGNEANFKGFLQVLKDQQNVTTFLREATKLVVLQALVEPELISDLKKC